MAKISNIELKQLPQRKILFIRKEIDFFKEYVSFMEEVIDKITVFLNQKKMYPTGGPITVFYNMDLDHLDVAVGFEIGLDIEGNNDLKMTILPAQIVATVIDQGPYQQQDPTLEELMSWIKNNGYVMTEGIYYHYLNDPQQLPEKYLTEMYIPVRKK